MTCGKHKINNKLNGESKKRRSERLSLAIIRNVLGIIDHTRKSRQQILEEVKKNNINATKHQIFKLLDNWVESGEIRKVKTLSDGRRVFYFKDPFDDSEDPTKVKYRI
ncbi:MAG: hypothetical protein ACXAC2_15590 [Candidatus Kariarchaeaceae archaeon]|jgi:Fe2+ or Zn2+ uptake regulation protein